MEGLYRGPAPTSFQCSSLGGVVTSFKCIRSGGNTASNSHIHFCGGRANTSVVLRGPRPNSRVMGKTIRDIMAFLERRNRV